MPLKSLKQKEVKEPSSDYSILDIGVNIKDPESGEIVLVKKFIEGQPEDIKTEYTKIRINPYNYLKYRYFFDNANMIHSLAYAKHIYKDGVESF